MGALLRLAGAVFGVVCVGLIMAQALIGAYLWSSGYLGTERLAELMAVLEGRATAQALALATTQVTAQRDAQASLSDLAKARAIRSLNLDLREQWLHNSLARYEADRIKLQDDSERYRQLKSTFDADLRRLREEVMASSEENARLILENIRAKQAKDQIARMIEAGEMDDVVILLSAMTVTKRAKIIMEFKTEEEAATLAELLKAIREAKPQLNLIEEAAAELQNGQDLN